MRTFALIGLFGGVWGMLATIVGPLPLGFAFLALAGAATLFRWRETEREQSYGMTTLVAALLTFSLGAYAALGNMTAAAAAAVAATALLAAKEWLHSWLRVLTWPELRAALILLAMSVVALPVLPNRGYGPYDALNPYELWLMTIAIAGVSFIGYVAVKLAGARYGPLIAGVAGGLVSSTATTLDLARKSKATPSAWRPQVGGALAASTTMFVRVGVIVTLFGPSLLARLAPPLAAAAIVSVVAALFLDPPWRPAPVPAEGESAHYRNPFDLGPVLGFAALLAVIMVASTAITAEFGGQGGAALAAVAGIADVDAISLSMISIARQDPGGAATAILVAVAANSLSKSVLALVTGSRPFGVAYVGATAAAILIGGLVAIMATFAA